MTVSKDASGGKSSSRPLNDEPRVDLMLTEADTCRLHVVPKLQAAGWDTDPHSIAERRSFTDGRIIVRGNKAERRKGKRPDYLLRYTRDFPIAVVEAKSEDEQAATGLQQAKDYAEILKLKFAYATNGREIIEFDYITGLERTLQSFPLPAELWSRLRAAEKLTDDSAAQRLLTLANLTTGKDPRYYQQIAINRVVQAIVQGKQRVLLIMATGTGKTVVAFQICWKLWSSKWNRKNEPQRKPRILYLADRNFLVDDPKDKTFSSFGDARWKIEGGNIVHSRELYFATYQSIAKDKRRPGLYKEFAPDFFDLIIVDECHRGSANEDSNWREILEYFKPAYQLGMTATPLRDETRDSYLYFAPEAREILNDLLEKHAADGELQFTLPDVLKVPPISQRGNVAEIIGKFGGADQLRNAVNQLQLLLYAA